MITKYTGSEKGSNVADTAYPVGSIYMSVNSTSPATLFGGTWEQIKDRFLLSAGDTYTAGSTGGEATHTLTVDEMPVHNHNIMLGWDNGGNGADTIGYDSHNQGARSYQYYTGGSREPAIQDKGGGQAHNNMPPYLAVYMWRRTA